MKDLIQAQRESLLQLNYDEYGDVGSNLNYINWHKSSTKSLLEAVIEMVEGMKENVDFDEEDNVVFALKLKGNQSLSDLQDKLKEEMRKI